MKRHYSRPYYDQQQRREYALATFLWGCVVFGAILYVIWRLT